MEDFDFDMFLVLRKHLKIVHHVPGRIRLRVAAALFKEFDGIDSQVFDKILGAIAGIKDVRVNALAGSVVISYAAKQIKPSWWDTLITGEQGRAVDLLRQLLVDELAPAVEAVTNNRG